MKGIQIYSNEGPRPFPREDNNKIAKNNLSNLKISFSRTTWPISTKLVTMHPWVKGIQVCLNEGPNPIRFPGGDYYKNSENTLTKLKKISSPEPLSQFQPILAQSILG